MNAEDNLAVKVAKYWVADDALHDFRRIDQKIAGISGLDNHTMLRGANLLLNGFSFQFRYGTTLVEGLLVGSVANSCINNSFNYDYLENLAPLIVGIEVAKLVAYAFFKKMNNYVENAVYPF